MTCWRRVLGRSVCHQNSQALGFGGGFKSARCSSGLRSVGKAKAESPPRDDGPKLTLAVCFAVQFFFNVFGLHCWSPQTTISLQAPGEQVIYTYALHPSVAAPAWPARSILRPPPALPCPSCPSCPAPSLPSPSSSLPLSRE